MRSLRAISLQNLRYSNASDILTGLSKFSGIVMLNMRGVYPITFELFHNVQFPSLQLLNLNYCRIKQILLPPQNLPALKELFCRGNLIESMSNFTGLRNLKLLDLAQNNLTYIDQKELPTNLVVLNLVGNRLV